MRLDDLIRDALAWAMDGLAAVGRTEMGVPGHPWEVEAPPEEPAEELPANEARGR